LEAGKKNRLPKNRSVPTNLYTKNLNRKETRKRTSLRESQKKKQKNVPMKPPPKKKKTSSLCPLRLTKEKAHKEKIMYTRHKRRNEVLMGDESQKTGRQPK